MKVFEVGKRYLIKEPYFRTLIEVKVLEVSPSKERVKFEFVSSAKVWEHITDWEIVEELAEAK